MAAASAIVILRPATSTDPSSPTIWQTVTADITGESVPAKTALEAFAYLFKVQIPGIDVPKAREGGDAPTSGTGVVTWVRADWASLTAQQQAVIEPYLDPGPDDKVIHLNLSAFGGPIVLARAPGGSTPNAVLAAAHANALPDNDPRFDAFATELAADLKHLGPKLGLPVVTPGIVGISSIPGLGDVSLIFSDQDGGNTKYVTYAETQYGQDYTPCNVTVYKNAWQNEQVGPGGQVSSTVHVDLTHEAVHCYQNEVWGSVGTSLDMPDWISEGTAEWLAGDDTGIVQENLPSAWQNRWFYDPEQPLTNRTYDADGYYALLDHLGRNLWSLMAPAWQAAKAATGDRSDPFIAALNGDAEDVRDAWAPSLLQRADWSDPWVTHGLGLPSDAHVTMHPIAGSTSPITGKLDSRSNQIDVVESSEGEIVQVDTSGLVSAHDEGTDMVLASTSEAFCTVASCVCPPGTLRAGEDLASQHMNLPFDLAFNAPDGGSTWVVTDTKLSDACEAQATPAPVGGGAGPGSGLGTGPPAGSGPVTPDCGTTGCAGDNGDPHMTTVDGQHYDFQAAGEFVLLRSADGATEIQGRQEPFDGSPSVAINTAVALRAGSHRVMVDLAPPDLALRVDGQPVDPASLPLDLGSGAQVLAQRAGFEIDLPDGTRVWTLAVGHAVNYGINLQIRPSQALRDGAIGILGRLADRTSGLPPLPDGTSLPPPTTDAHARYVRLYQTFADAWRVTDAASLFNYANGASTATYAKAGFPQEGGPMSFGDLSPTAQTTGLAQCASITAPELQQECAYDVSVTGNPAFGGLYEATEPTAQTVGTSPTPPSGPAPTTPSGPIGSVAPGSMVAPGIPQLLDGADEITGAALGPDDSLYVSLFMANSSSEVVATGPHGLAITSKATIPDATSVAVTAGSVWVGEKQPDGTCAIARLDPVTLAVQATIPATCLLGMAYFAAHDNTIWFIDTTKMDVDLHGAVFRRIDPATNAVTDTSIPMESANGYLYESADNASLIFVTNTETWFLAPGATEFETLGKLSDPTQFAADNGAWAWTSDTDTATLSGPNGAITVLPERWYMLGADASAIYANGGPASTTTSTLWRYPIDGTPGQQIATGATVPDAGGTVDLDYFDNWPFLVGSHTVVKLWLPLSPHANGDRALDIQWTPVP